MRYEINGRAINVHICDYIRARRISKHINIALNMIEKYGVKDKLDIEFEYSSSPFFYVGIKYNIVVSPKDPMWLISSRKKHYIFSGYNFRFNKKDFYDRVIKQYTKKEYSEA